MRTGIKIIVVVACVAVTLLAVSVYGLFHGYFDRGQFKIKQAQWSSSKQVAMVAERSDQEALGGLTYFVAIGNRVFSPTELRHAYYSDAVVFAATATCLTVHWENPNKLDVGCNGSYVDQNQIDVQKRQSGEVTIVYENIALE